VKRFHFGLERVLSLKEHRERLAEMRQQFARARLEQAQAECQRLEAELVRTATSAATKLREAVRLGTWQAPYEQSALLSEMLAAAQKRTAEAEKQLQEADQLRIQATREAEALRSLRTRQWQSYRQEVARQRQNNLDELGLQRWLAKRDAGPFGGPALGEGDEL
jgi:flagellar export protein FliJ